MEECVAMGRLETFSHRLGCGKLPLATETEEAATAGWTLPELKDIID